MQCENAVVKRSIVSPMLQRVIREILILWNEFVQKETEEGEPK